MEVSTASPLIFLAFVSHFLYNVHFVLMVEVASIAPTGEHTEYEIERI